MKLLDILKDLDKEVLGEAYVYVVRKGKKKRRKKPREGYRIVDGKYVRMSMKERKKRKVSQKRAAKKRRTKKSQILRKRKTSMRKRRSMGLT